MSARPQTDRPNTGHETAAGPLPRLISAVLTFIGRTLLICGYMALVTAIILVVSGEYARSAPFFVFGAISALWTWRKISRWQ